MTIPHSGLLHRTFALDPLLALAPALCDPEGVPYARHRAQLGPSDAAPRPWRHHGFLRCPNGDLCVDALDRADGWAAVAEALESQHTKVPSDASTTVMSLELSMVEMPQRATARWVEALAAHLDAAEVSLVRAVVTADEGLRVLATLWCAPVKAPRREAWPSRVEEGEAASAWPWRARVRGPSRR